MKYYYLAVCLIVITLCITLAYSDNLAHEKDMKQLEIKKLELELKIREKECMKQ